MIETKDQHKVNAICSSHGGGRFQRNKAPGKPWKKFKGFCKNCGIQGHKAVNCTKRKEIRRNGCRKKQEVVITVIRLDT
jgi:hypothetical protein